MALNSFGEAPLQYRMVEVGDCLHGVGSSVFRALAAQARGPGFDLQAFYFTSYY